MTEFIDFHEARAAQERTRAAALAPGRLRDLHSELADLHRDQAVSLTIGGTTSEFGYQQR